jgi:hypothetical protein
MITIKPASSLRALFFGKVKMKITKVYSKRHKEYRWKLDVTIEGKRIQRASFLTKKEAEKYGFALVSDARRRSIIRRVSQIQEGK